MSLRTIGAAYNCDDVTLVNREAPSPTPTQKIKKPMAAVAVATVCDLKCPSDLFFQGLIVYPNPATKNKKPNGSSGSSDSLLLKLPQLSLLPSVNLK